MQLNTSGISEYISEGYNGDAAGDRKKALFGRIWDWFDLGLTYYPKRIFSLQPVFLMSVLLNTVKMLKPLLKGYYKYEGINPNFSSTDAQKMSMISLMMRSARYRL
jgi:hypothetical protein